MRLETSLQVVWRCVMDRRRPKQAGRANPDVEPTEGVQDLVDEDDCFFLFGDVERVRDDLCRGVVLGDGLDDVFIRV